VNGLDTSDLYTQLQLKVYTHEREVWSARTLSA